MPWSYSLTSAWTHTNGTLRTGRTPVIVPTVSVIGVILSGPRCSVVDPTDHAAYTDLPSVIVSPPPSARGLRSGSCARR
jgi:hypothetical protein